MKRLSLFVMAVAFVFVLAIVFASNAMMPRSILGVDEPAEAAEPVAQVQRADPDRPFTYADIAQTGRPQFLNGYATWCPYCQENDPIIFALQREFQDRIDFIHLNVDGAGVLDAAAPYSITGVTQYVLLDPDGEIVEKWFGYIDHETMTESFTTYLDAAL
jgi:thiol-disulfide isomerase/thioredoxin